MSDIEKKINAPRLPANMVNNCKMLTDRYHILQHLPKNGIGIEIGVLGGDWSQHLLDNTKPKELILADTFNSNDYPHKNRFQKNNHEFYIKTKFETLGEQVKVMKGLSWDTLSVFPDHYFDWMYIDAAHDYESVKKDLAECIRVLKPNGYLVMNDYILYDHFTKEEYGVVQATNEFMLEHKFEMIYFALHPEMFCDVVIRKIQD
ncbi:class I SAM-dependent methyltransferase [bacterium]|nr:class I SAM-dependent methyltransferase [bacterium]